MGDYTPMNKTSATDAAVWQENFASFPPSPPVYQTLPPSASAPEPPPAYSQISLVDEQNFSYQGSSDYNTQPSASPGSNHFSSENDDDCSSSPMLDQPLGVREVVLRKDYKGKVGLTVKHFHHGIFISYVQPNSSACLSGLETGDQILQINGEFVSSYTAPQVHEIFKRGGFPVFRLLVREKRYFGIRLPRYSISTSMPSNAYNSFMQSLEPSTSLRRTMTFEKDHWGRIGFGFRNGVIHMIVGGSPAACNGLLINQRLIEVNGRNVIAMKDKEIGNIIRAGGDKITLTIAGAHEGF